MGWRVEEEPERKDPKEGPSLRRILMFDVDREDELAAGLAAVIARRTVVVHAREEKSVGVENIIRVQLHAPRRVAVSAKTVVGHQSRDDRALRLVWIVAIDV